MLNLQQLITIDMDHRRTRGYLRWIALTLLCLTLAACGRSGVRGGGGEYVVQPGDTLYSIAWRYGLDLERLAQLNGIAPPYTIRPGQRIKLDSGADAPVARARQGAGSAGGGGEADAASAPDVAPFPWIWPTEGTVVKRFTDNDATKPGIDIKGTYGQPVVAAAAGRVVYSGNGLKGYGELIIVKHYDAYLSAYAYNRRRLAKEGDTVQAGERIAELGRSDNQQPVLHFEIRRFGKPVDPLLHLPPR